MMYGILCLFLFLFAGSEAYNQCGIRGPQNRVAGGREAGIGEWPWQVKQTELLSGRLLD